MIKDNPDEKDMAPSCVIQKEDLDDVLSGSSRALAQAGVAFSKLHSHSSQFLVISTQLGLEDMLNSDRKNEKVEQ